MSRTMPACEHASEVYMSKSRRRPVVTLGPVTLRALAGNPGAYRWRAEWYPPGDEGRMQTRSLMRRRGERIDRTEAVRRGTELLTAGVHLHGEQGADRHRTVSTVLDLMELWLGLQRNRVGVELRPTTFRNYRLSLKRLARLPIASLRLSDLDQVHVIRAAKQLRAELATTTAATNLRIFAAVLAWGAQKGLVRPVKVPATSAPTPPQHMPSIDDVLRTVDALEGWPDTSARETALVVKILAGTGARPRELARTRADDLRLARDGRPLWIIQPGEGAKTGQRQVPLSASVVAAFRSCMDGRITGRLWHRASRDEAHVKRWRVWIRRACDAAGVPRWTPKGLRHLAVSRLLEAGIDVATAASITGHSPEVLLRVYAHVFQRARLSAVDLLALPAGEVIPLRGRR